MSSLATVVADAPAAGSNETESMTDRELSDALYYRHSVSKGDVMYVVCIKWYVAAKRFYNDLHGVEPAPGPIDNEAILEPPLPFDSPWRKLKPPTELREGTNYELVPEAVWNELTRRHGCTAGHAVRRETYEVPTQYWVHRKDYRVELYPAVVRVHLCDEVTGLPDTSVPSASLVLGERDGLAEVINNAKLLFDTEGALKVRAWYRDIATATDDGNTDNWSQLSQDAVKQIFSAFDSKGMAHLSPDAPDDAAPGSGTTYYELLLEKKKRDGQWTRGPRQNDEVVEDVVAWRRGLKVGDSCDAQDGTDKDVAKPQWYESHIVDTRTEDEEGQPCDELKMHFHGWKAKFDEWVPRMSDRVYPRFTKVPDWRSQLKMNERVDYKCPPSNKWYEAVVKKIDRTVEGSERVKIVSTYLATPHFNCWVSLTSESIMPLYTHVEKKQKGVGVASRYYAGAAEAPGVVGLRNLGNTCYMNSMLQCMSNATPVTEYFLSEKYEDDINLKNILGTGGRLARVYAGLMEDLWKGGEKSVAPREFKEEIGRVNAQFSGFQQQDSQELFTFLVDSLHEDLNRVKQKPYTEDVEHGGRPDDVVAAESWVTFRKRNDSHFVDCFYGLLRSHLTDPFTNDTSVKFDPACGISVPIPVSNKYELGLTYFPSRANGGPSAARKFHLSASKQGTMEEFCQAVSDATGVPLERLVCVEIHGHKVFKVLYELCNKINTRVRELAKGDIVHMYELEAPITAQHAASKLRSAKGVIDERKDECEDVSAVHADHFRINVIFSKKSTYNNYNYSYSRPENIAAPVTLTVPVDATCADVHKQLVEITAPMFSNTKAAATVPEEEHESVPPPVPDPTPRELFDVKLVDQHASTEYDEVAADDATNLLDLIKAQKRTGYYYNTYAKEKFHLRLMLTTLGAERFDLEMVSGGSAPMHESQRVDESDGANVDGRLTLESCLRKYNTREQLGPMDEWYSPFSKKHVQAWKEMSIWSLPEILVIHLKRFSYEAGQYMVHREKVSSLVHFPLRGLDMAPYTLGPEKDSGNTIYDLFAVSNHFGGLGGGHYTAFAKNHKNGKWYDFDDASVRAIQENEIVSSNAYVLFYQRRRSEDASLKK